LQKENNILMFNNIHTLPKIVLVLNSKTDRDKKKQVLCRFILCWDKKNKCWVLHIGIRFVVRDMDEEDDFFLEIST
jgi:hypothetical protein